MKPCSDYFPATRFMQGKIRETVDRIRNREPRHPFWSDDWSLSLTVLPEPGGLRLDWRVCPGGSTGKYEHSYSSQMFIGQCGLDPNHPIYTESAYLLALQILGTVAGGEGYYGEVYYDEIVDWHEKRKAFMAEHGLRG